MQPYRFLADLILLAHVAIVLFIVGGLAVVVVGNLRHWRWVNNYWFRLTHLAAIGVVMIQAWLGEICPLTTLESWLRTQAGMSGYSESFIQHWVQQLLYYDAPFWIFATVYTLFALVVLFVWWCFPPRASR